MPDMIQRTFNYREHLMKFLPPLYYIAFLYSLLFAVHSCIHSLIYFLLSIVGHSLAVKWN